jgi:hypothetical protein
MSPTEKPDEKARFEAMLAQVLTTDEEARGHRAEKNTRGAARFRAVDAKRRFEANRPRRSRAGKLRR